jgi:hypothetical protein
MALVAHQKQLHFWKLSTDIKFENTISLNYNLKKCHDLGHLSFSLSGVNQNSYEQT